MAAKKSAPPEQENATFGRDGYKGKKKNRKVIIPPAAFDIIAFATEENQFVKALYDISTGVINDYEMDQFYQAAISTIRRETEDYYSSKAKGGMASVESRAKTMEPVRVPNLTPPSTLNSIDIGSKYREWHISPKEILEIRYVMFARNYAPSEVERCLNEFLIKRPNQGVPISGMDELWEKVQKWDKFDRAAHFRTCPEFHQLCMQLMMKANPSLRAEFMDKRFSAEFARDNNLHIRCSSNVKTLLMENMDSLMQTICANHPGSQVVFDSIISGFW